MFDVKCYYHFLLCVCVFKQSLFIPLLAIQIYSSCLPCERFLLRARELDTNRYAPSGLPGAQAALEHYIQNLFPAKGGEGVGEGFKGGGEVSVDKPSKHKGCGFVTAVLSWYGQVRVNEL